MTCPEIRIRVLNPAKPNAAGSFVLYWMTATRRTRDNFALDRAIDWCVRLGKPLIILEGLRADYRHASDRHHAFVLDGMFDNARSVRGAAVRYAAYVEPEPGAGRGLLRELGRHAAVIVADRYPTFFHPAMTAALARGVEIRVEDVDSLGLFPLECAEGAFVSAYHFRRFLQKRVREYLAQPATTDPFDGRELVRPVDLPSSVLARWPEAALDDREGSRQGIARLPIDHAVPPTAALGGAAAAELALERFLAAGLPRYADDRSHPDDDIDSRLSPYLHFGHIASRRILDAIFETEDWDAARLADKVDGARAGFWGLGPNAEAFVDQLVTWRELGQIFAARRPDHESYAALPEWSRRTLAKHAADPRRPSYELATLESATTHDEVWNAAQRQLVGEGRLHNYMRMLWGKKILEWSPHPEEAHRRLVHLNDKYALDGRDPNSYSGIGWCLGLFDRPWAPERPIYGTVRYMSSDNTKRKLRVKNYLERWRDPRSRQKT